MPVYAAIIRRTPFMRLTRSVHVGTLLACPRTVASSPQVDTRSYLVERFSSDVADLERLLDINLDAWRESWSARRGDTGPS